MPLATLMIFPPHPGFSDTRPNFKPGWPGLERSEGPDGEEPDQRTWVAEM
jgi:hypothetical protein